MLESHLKTITMIESEKLDLLEAAKDREGDLSEINTQLSEMISSNEELQREKVKCELRCVELEEQQDILQKEGEDLKETLSTLKSTLTEFETRLSTVQSEKSSRVVKCSSRIRLLSFAIWKPIPVILLSTTFFVF